MKKPLLTILFVMAFGLLNQQANAQTGQLDFGIRGGVNFATLNNVDGNVDTNTGLMLGLYFNKPVFDHVISIQPEILYNQKGFDIGNDTYRLDYLEIPVLARFDILPFTALSPFVYFGPYVGFVVNKNFPDQIANANLTPFPGVDQNLEDNVNDVGFGVTVGGGLDFGRIDIGVRYDAGLTDVFDTNNSDAKNGVFSIVAGLGF